MSEISTYFELKIPTWNDQAKDQLREELSEHKRPLIVNLLDCKDDLTVVIQEIVDAIKSVRTFFHLPYPIFFLTTDTGKYNEDLTLFRERHELPLFFTLKNKTITKLHQSKIRKIKTLHKILDLTPFKKAKQYMRDYAVTQAKIHHMLHQNKILSRILGSEYE